MFGDGAPFDMHEGDPGRFQTLLRRIRDHISTGSYRLTQHAQQQMTEEGILLDEVEEAIVDAEVLEDYPYHRRGACCLLGGFTSQHRPLHVVCTTGLPISVIITVYEPKAPKWVTPAQRRE